MRRIEPYSLRQTAEGNYVLHAIRSDSGEHRSYRIDRMHGAAITDQAFAPRYVVELTQSGPLPVTQPSSVPRRTVRWPIHEVRVDLSIFSVALFAGKPSNAAR